MKLGVAFTGLFLAASLSGANAATMKDVDLMFVVDRSSSMGNEFRTLAANIGVVYEELQNSGVVGSVGAGLIAYEGRAAREDSELLVQPITTDTGAFQSSTSDFINNVGVRGGTERALAAIDSAIPGGADFLGSGWRDNTVRSIVLITDEDADDARQYAYAGQTGYSALGQYLDDTGYLNNIITTSRLFDTFAPIQRPGATADEPYPALFDLAAFTGSDADPAAFFRNFANVKAQEIAITDAITDRDNDGIPDTEDMMPSPIPLPASLPLLIAGLAAMGVLRRRA